MQWPAVYLRDLSLHCADARVLADVGNWNQTALSLQFPQAGYTLCSSQKKEMFGLVAATTMDSWA